jgi:glycyl-tRNA synthetase beta chain
VLTARLSDAQFFFSEDRKKLLKDLIPGLAKVAFYDKLGTIYEKVERITALSDWIAKELKIPEQQRENIREIAKLCKTDLLTHMVYEFPSLQGVMGREYSLLEGKPKEIASGIYEHYLPRFADDALPASTEGAIVSIADKIDSITGCFSIGIIPSGSEDPFGLRRQAQGVVSVLSGKKIELELDSLIEKAYKFYEPLFLGELFITGKVKYDQVDKVKSNVLAFLAARLKGMMLDDGISYDVADAVLAVFKSVPDSRAKARELQKHIKEEWFKKLVFTADRISRLAKNATRGNVIEADLAVEEEKALYALYLEVNAAMNEALDVNDITKALQALTKLTKPVDDLFIKVMVMDKDERLKANRLALLKTLERTYMEIADFSKIVI